MQIASPVCTQVRQRCFCLTCCIDLGEFVSQHSFDSSHLCEALVFWIRLLTMVMSVVLFGEAGK